MNCTILFPKAITGTFDEMFSADLLVVKNKIYKQFIFCPWFCKYTKIHWKLMIDQKSRIVFEISKMVQYSKRTFGYQVSDETDPNHGSFLFFEKFKRNHGAIFLMRFQKIARWFLPDCSRNLKPQWLGCVLFETWYPKVRFEYWTIFEGYLRARIFKNQFWFFIQSSIFNVFSNIFKIKDKRQLK